jgi:hypothetical protein
VLIADREGAFGWSVPNEEQFAFHIVQTRELGVFLCGRRLYETMLVWETDLSLRDDEGRWRHAVSATGQRRRPAGSDRDQDVRLACDLRALPTRPR